MRSLVIVLVILASLLAPIGGFVLATSEVPTVQLIEEDDPRWDCSTMGNGVCGPVLPDVTAFEDGSFRVECPAYGELYSRDGSDSVGSLACRPV